MELQFYNPGYVKQFDGYSCLKNKYCAAMTIDSYEQDMNTGQLNNSDCYNYFLAGVEPINWAYITTSGVSQAPANPIATSSDPNLTALTPDPKKDLLMSPGDKIEIQIFDTPQGVKTILTDLTTHQQGSMTASVSNGFGQVMFEPNSSTCHVNLYAFHPMYSTASTQTRVPWAAHSYNVAFSDEIGHFEYCGAIDGEFGNCTEPGATDPDGVDADDGYCFDGAASPKYKIIGCLNSDDDFDGPPYQTVWPGAINDPVHDSLYDTTPVQFTTPTFNGGQNYDQVAFEVDMPRIESTCDRTTGSGCTNPPPGANFYPIFTTTSVGGQCWWQEGGRFIPGTTNIFGGTPQQEYGTKLLKLAYPNAGNVPEFLYEDYRNVQAGNPCPVG